MFGAFIGGLLGLIFFRNFFGIIIGSLVGYYFFTPRRGGRTATGRGFNFGFGGMYDIHKRQEMYFKTLFTLLGKMAKVDGTVSKVEGEYLLAVIKKMQLEGQLKVDAIQYFNTAKHEPESPVELAQQFHQMFSQIPQLARQLLYQLVGIAAADGYISSQEQTIIEQIARVFVISEQELSHILNTFNVSSDTAYHVLGISRQTSDDQVRKVYRALLKEYHPDMLRGKGLPESLMKDAEKRFLSIQKAWESIKQERSID